VDVTDLLLLVAISFLAGAIHGAGGFGFGLVSIGLYSLIMGVTEAVLVAIALTMITSVGILWKSLNLVNWRLAAPVFVSAMVARIAVFPIAHHYGGSDAMRFCLGVFLGIFGLRLLWQTFKRTPRPVRPIGPVAAAGVGLLAGLTGGIFGIAGPWYSLFFLNRGLDGPSYRANLQLAFVGPNAVTLLLHSGAGDVTRAVLAAIAAGAIFAWLGSRTGVFITGRLMPVQIERLACCIVLVAGGSLVFRAIM